MFGKKGFFSSGCSVFVDGHDGTSTIFATAAAGGDGGRYFRDLERDFKRIQLRHASEQH